VGTDRAFDYFGVDKHLRPNPQPGLF
jgi:hypothetical protein